MLFIRLNVSGTPGLLEDLRTHAIIARRVGGLRVLRSRTGFDTIVLPYCKKLTGPKVLIGDNLSSHFSPIVIQACEANNIRFCCLPPNSTHLTQPLDVSFFRPLKLKWRSILTDWKLSKLGRKGSAVAKDKFPTLLAEVTLAMKATQVETLKSGFRACGIVPLDRNAVLSKIPNTNLATDEDGRDVDQRVSESVITVLQTLRYNGENPPKKKEQKKKISVEPGQSVTMADIPVAVSSISKGNKAVPSISKANGAVTSSSKASATYVHDKSQDEMDGDTIDNDDSSSGNEDEDDHNDIEDIDIGRYVIVSYPTVAKKYVGKVISKIHHPRQLGDWRVKFTRRVVGKSLTFRFDPDDEDVDGVDICRIQAVLPEPRLNPRSGYITFSDFDFCGMMLY